MWSLHLNCHGCGKIKSLSPLLYFFLRMIEISPELLLWYIFVALWVSNLIAASFYMS